MAKSMVQIFREMEDAVTDFYIRMVLGHEGVARIWEQKMPFEVFDTRMDNRRHVRKEGNMALLRMIGGLLTVLFWFFVLIGTLAVIGLTIYSPLIASIVLICILAGVLNAWHRRGRQS